MNRRIAKKKELDSIKHGYYKWQKEISRKGNTADEHCSLRNNWRRWNKYAMLRRTPRGNGM